MHMFVCVCVCRACVYVYMCVCVHVRVHGGTSECACVFLHVSTVTCVAVQHVCMLFILHLFASVIGSAGSFSSTCKGNRVSVIF